ncbi:unnamed protein product, partial [Ectocarpus sp. 13 AM-2016]
MTSISKEHDLQGNLQVSLAAESGQQTCSATEQFLAEFEDVPAIAATITPRGDAHSKRQTATGSKKPKSSEHCVGRDPGPTSQRGELECGSIGGPYGWSPSSCDRHLRRRRRSRSRTGANITTTNAPKALVDGEMEMALAGGSRLAMKAMRAVQQANAQVCYANLETARKDIALGVERQKYKRLEADMCRSRVELADTLCDVETDREKHESEMAQAEERAKELEVALRAADEVLRQLTAETKQKRYDAEDREASLRARLVAVERRAEASERDCRHQKLSTWRTITRETERAAARERYRLAAFLQRYVVENEFLRASKAKAEESASDLRETLRQTEGKLVKALAAAPAPLRGPETLMSNARKATWAMGMANRGVQAHGGGAGAGGAAGGRAYGGPQARGWGGAGAGAPEGQAAAAGDPPAQPTAAVAAVSQAEMAIRRMKGQAGTAREKRSDFSNGGGGGDNVSELGSWSGSNWGRGGKSAQRAATASVRGELRYTRGLVAELSFLLSATESERDSLASLVALAEQRMERLVVSQEELALRLAWGNVSSMEEQHHYEQRRFKQQQQQQQPRCLQVDGEGGRYARAAEGLSAVTGQQPRQIESSATLASEEGSGGNDVHRSPDDGHEPATNPESAPATAATFEKSREALDKLELGRRVRELEVLLEATEAGAREIEQKNRRLQNLHGRSPRPWQSWNGGGGVVSSTAGDDSRRRHYGETSRSNVTMSGSGRNGSPRLDGGNDSGREAEETSRNGARSGQSTRGHAGHGQNSVSLPMLAAAEVGRGGGESSGTRAGSETTVVAQTAEGAGFSFSEPAGWDWTRESGATSRPEGRCRPRSSPFATQRRGDYSWEEPGSGSGSGSGGGGGDGTEGRGEISNGDEAAFLIKGQLAWVLGLPAETTETQLLAEVMHLVVERGSANTDARVLEAQLGKMDEQSLSLTRLAAAAIASHGGGGGRDRGHAVLAGGGAGGGRRRGEGHRGSSGGGLNLADLGSGYSSNATFLSSLSHADGSGGGAGGGRGARRATHLPTAGHQHADRANNAANDDTNHAVAAPAAAAAAPVRQKTTAPDRGGRAGHNVDASASQQRPAGRDGVGGRVAERRDRWNGVGPAAPSAGAAAVGAGKPVASSTTADGSGGVSSSEPFDEDTVRTTFSKTVQGRVVSIDVFCSKVMSEAERKQEEERGDARETGVKMDDVDYEIRVEAYDPAVLKHHVLHIQDEHIKGCLRAHPHLYTLGPNRTRVHESLVERLVLMSEEDVKAEQSQQGRAGGGGGGGVASSGISGGGGGGGGDGSGGGGMDRPSSVASGGSSGGGGGVRGGASSGPGAKPGEEPNLLLVLIGDAGELVTAEKRPEENADGTEGGAAVAPEKRVHRHAKSAIMQAR